MDESYNKRQKQIIDSAIKLIGQQGIQGLTIKNLSKEVGIAESAIYRHFESKTSIICAVLSFLKNSIIKNYSEILNLDIPPTEKIIKLLSRHFKFFNDNPPLTIVLFSDGMYKNEPELTKMIMAIMQFVKNAYIIVIDEGQNKKLFRTDISSEYLSFILMGGVRLTVNQWGLSGYKYKLKTKGEELTEAILKIISV